MSIRLDVIHGLATLDWIPEISIADRLDAIGGLASWARLHAAVIAEHSDAA